MSARPEPETVAPPGPRVVSARTVIVVPALNEEGSIGAVVTAARRALPGGMALVVDDGSQDATAAEGRRAGAQVLQLPFNCGIGVAVQTGLRAAVDAGADVVVRLDGDGQHDAAEIAKLVAAVEAGADIAVGSRFLVPAAGYRSSPLRRVGIRWFAFVLRLVGAGTVTDPTSGFFAANRRTAQLLARHYASDYPEVDTIVRLARWGYRRVEVPVEMHERQAGSSSIRGTAIIVYMVRITAAILVTWLESVGPAADVR